MSKYKLIIEYYSKGNNKIQISTLCGCSRTTVWEVLKRLELVEISMTDVLEMSEEEIAYLLFPERTRRGQGYLIPDFKWEEFQIVKHRSSIRLCWRRYCKRAVKQNLKAYSWKSFCIFYQNYRKPTQEEDKDFDRIRKRLKEYNLLLTIFSNKNGDGYKKLKKEKEDWLKSLHLDEDKILD